MRIRFVKPDPRAGMVAQMDSLRGYALVEAGAAEQIDEQGQALKPAPQNPQSVGGAPLSASPAAQALPQTTANESEPGVKRRGRKPKNAASS